MIETDKARVHSVLYDDLTRSLFVGYDRGHVKQFKRDGGCFALLKDYGDVGIGEVLSCARIGPLAFFGGSEKKVVAIHIHSQELVGGFLQTAFGLVCSLRVCSTGRDRTLLAVSGRHLDHSKGGFDLFDVTRVLTNCPNPGKVSVFENLSHANQTIRAQQEEIEQLTTQVKALKAKSKETLSRYDQLKSTYDQLKSRNDQLRKNYVDLKTRSGIRPSQFSTKINLLFHHKPTRTTFCNKSSPFKTQLFDLTDPLVILRDLREDLDEQKHTNRQLQNTIYDVLTLKKLAEQQTSHLELRLGAAQSRIAETEEVVRQK